MNNFCNEINQENVTCFSYKKDDAQGFTKSKQSHQFPNMQIDEVSNKMDSLIPCFNRFITKLEPTSKITIFEFTRNSDE